MIIICVVAVNDVPARGCGRAFPFSARITVDAVENRWGREALVLEPPLLVPRERLQSSASASAAADT